MYLRPSNLQMWIAQGFSHSFFLLHFITQSHHCQRWAACPPARSLTFSQLHLFLRSSIFSHQHTASWFPRLGVRGGRISVLRPSFITRPTNLCKPGNYFTYTYTLLIAFFRLFAPHVKAAGECQSIIRCGSTIMTLSSGSALTHH